MTGHLHLTAALDPRTGRTALGAQSFRAPVHIGKGHWDGDTGTLTVHTVNATAGLFAGDAVDWRVCVEPGARLRLVSPSATRVFRHARPGLEGKSGEDARTDQTFHVGGAGAWLEVRPEGFIPHAGSRHRQTVRLDVESGGAALLCEIIAPGRVASGESWVFERLRWALDISHAGRPVVRERWDLQPAQRPESLAGWRLEGRGGFAAAPFHASLYLIGAGAQALDGLQEEDAGGSSGPGSVCWIGASRLSGGAGWMVKVLAADGAVLRRTLRKVRAALLAARGSS